MTLYTSSSIDTSQGNSGDGTLCWATDTKDLKASSVSGGSTPSFHSTTTSYLLLKGTFSIGSSSVSQSWPFNKHPVPHRCKVL